MGQLLGSPKFQAFDSEGAPASGYQLFTYAPGTATKKATYSDRALSSANTNPIVLNSRGEATIYLDGTTKLVLALPTAADPPLSNIWSMDYIDGIDQFYSANRFYVDASETDQGAVGSGDSCKDFVDAIGSDSATLVFRHTGTGATTTYTFSTSETIPSNIAVEIEKGAVLAIGAGVTLTLSDGCEILAGRNQIFSGAGAVAYQGIGYPEWRGCLGDGSTDDSSAMGYALSEFEGVELRADAVYVITNVTLAGNDKRIFGNGTLKHKASATTAMLTVSGARNTIDGIEVDGNKANVTNTSARCIYITGDGNTVKNCYIHDSNLTGIYSLDADYTLVESNKFIDCGNATATTGSPGAAILNGGDHNKILGNYAKTPGYLCFRIAAYDSTTDSQYGIIANNTVEAYSSTYGATLSIAISGSASSGRRVENFLITGNVIKTGSGNGIDVNGAYQVIISNNIIEGAGAAGINPDCNDVGGTDITITGNTIISPTLQGILIQGDDTGAVACTTAAVTNNLIIDPGGTGISVDYAKNSNVSNNIIKQTAASSSTAASGIYVADKTTLSMFNNNVIMDERAGASAHLTVGVYFGTNGGKNVALGNKLGSAARKITPATVSWGYGVVAFSDQEYALDNTWESNDTVSTSDATANQNVTEFACSDGYSYIFTGQVIASSGEQALYNICAGYYKATTLAEIGESTVAVGESDAGMDCNLNPAGGEVEVRVTGIAATNINWHVTYKVVGKAN